MKPVLVFRTSVNSSAAIERIKPLFKKTFHHGERWNFDLEDWENILRVEDASCDSNQVIETLKSAGFACEELAD